MVFAAVLVGIASMPIIASAIPNTVDEIRLQIADLTKRIEELKKQLAELEKEKPIAWCHTFNINLRVGDRSDEVRELGIALDKEGFAVVLSDKARDPLFNESFASAVVGFQEKYKSEILTPNGLQRGTGYVGPSTRKKLNALYGCAMTIPGNKPPVIKGASGPVKLKIGEVGTWTVSAMDPEGASLRYSVVWGDERLGVAGTGKILKENRTGSTNSQEASFTHSFSSVGIYKILFSVTDNAGNEARSTITVNVGEATEKNGYLYLVPDKVDFKVGETQEIKAYYQPPMPQCASGYACIQMMPVSYRVPAKFTSDNLEVVDIAVAIPMCIPADPSSGNYCGEMAIAQGKKIGSATITATYNGLSVSTKATVR